LKNYKKQVIEKKAGAYSKNKSMEMKKTGKK